MANLSNVLAIPLGSLPDVEEWAHANLLFEDADGVQHKCFDIHGEHLYMPRGAWHQCPINIEVTDNRSTAPVNMPEPLLSLRDYQSIPVSKMLKKGYGILRAPTGSGKTMCMLWLAAKLGQRTLILVHTKDLLSQWRERCESMLGFSPGIIGNGQWDEHELITIGMVQTLMRYEQLPPDWLETWGTVMLDEAHRAPASSFMHVMSQMTAKYMFGATATPTRRDGTHPMMHAVIGPVVASIKEQALVKSGQLMRPDVHMIKTGFGSINGVRMSMASNSFYRNQLYQKMLDEIAIDEQRAEVIAQQVVRLRGHHQLVLSKRIKHLELISQKIADIDPFLSTFVLTGSHHADERADVLRMVGEGNISVLLATQLADEGLDLPVLDVLHLTFPGRALEKLQQQVGRIMRTADGKHQTHVYDYVDDSIAVMRRQAHDRWQWYRGRQCKMSGWSPVKRHGGR